LGLTSTSGKHFGSSHDISDMVSSISCHLGRFTAQSTLALNRILVLFLHLLKRHTLRLIGMLIGSAAA
jgi:hypothetical protein